jgi:glycosyltransferase involved in cell wall biosynthesis
MGAFRHSLVSRVFKLKSIPSAPGVSMRHTLHGFQSAIYTGLIREKFDIAFSRNIFYAFLSTRFLKVPTIYDAHHPIANTAARIVFSLFRESEFLLKLVAISKGIGDIYLKLGLSKQKLTIAPNGVDIERFNQKLIATEARNKLGLPQERKIISHIGNIYPGRGIELLIEAALEFKNSLFLIVGGEDRDIERYKNQAKKIGVDNVIFTGFVPPSIISLYFFSTDLLILPYTSKMTSKFKRIETDFASLLKLPEYMASGCPIISTQIPAVSEFLRDGENAIIIDPDSTSAIIWGIKKALSNKNLCEKIAKQAAIDAKKYTLEERAKKILDDVQI